MKAVAIFCAAAIAIAPFAHAEGSGNFSSTCVISDAAKVNCGEVGILQTVCQSRGCCWVPSSIGSGVPWCFRSQPATPKYSLSEFEETSTGFHGILQLQRDPDTTYGADISTLSLDVYFETPDVVRVKISDAKNQRWEVPESVVKRFHSSAQPRVSNVKFSYTASPFSFEITRRVDGMVLFKLGDSFAFKDQYIEVPTSVFPGARTFGLGESTRTNHALEPGHTYTLWAADIPAMILKQNLYGAYPYYVQMVRGRAHGAMLLNSNGMDVSLTHDSLTFKTIGGIVDLYVFNGPTPEAVVQQYTGIIGKPAMFPYWTLGFHSCRWGYENLQHVKDVVANYSAAGIPLDTQWIDIDYMQNYRDFTYDAVAFPPADVRAFVDELHGKGMHFVPILDPGIMPFAGYDAYEQAVKDDLFVKDISGGYYLGQVWPGPTHFPDFTHPKAQEYWTGQMKGFLELVPADGIWIDMNEVSNFCNMDGDGQVCVNNNPDTCPDPQNPDSNKCCLTCTQVDSSNKYDYPPYHITNSYGKLSRRTMSMSATHYNNVPVYDFHNLYGLTEQIATHTALRTLTGKRPFVLSRSSFISTGVHSAKWSGDNGATWNNLKASIVSVLDFNLFGVPMIGADICGFMMDTTEELCARWIEVGAFYPFSRNHNSLKPKPQELYLWESVTEAARSALNLRYQLLPYLYTLFYQAHRTGGTVARALWHNYPTDLTAVEIDSQFMWGDAMLFSPVLEKGATSVHAYFPAGRWYNFATRAWYLDASDAGQWVDIDTPLTATNVHVRGGSILPLQQAAMTTTAGRQTPFTILVALCGKGGAQGQLFWDDGDQLELVHFLDVSYQAQSTSATSGSISAQVQHNSFPDAQTLALDSVQILGVSGASGSAVSVSVNGVAVPSAQVAYDAVAQALTVSQLQLHMDQDFTLTWQLQA